MELINVQKQTIGDEEINAVDARELHEFLEVKTHYSTWIARQIKRYGFVMNSDFSILKTATGAGGDDRIDYIITIDMAKELSMVERNEKGKQARRYFIECERRAKQIPQLTPAEQLLKSVQLTVKLERKQRQLEIGHVEHDRRIEMIEARMKEDPGYFAITGYAKLKGIKVDGNLAKRLGMAATKLSKQLGISVGKIKHTQWGLVNSYHESILDRVFSDFEHQMA